MSPRPKITIAMPVFNGGEYFEQALDSAVGQSYADIEIIVVNDGSTDGGHTERVAQRFARHIRYFDQPNGGVASALNTVIGNMTGDVFTWLSHDDIFELEKTEAQVDYWLSAEKPDACLISDFCLIDAHGVITQEVRLDREPILDAPMLPLYRGMISGCTVFLPKVVLDDVGGFDVRLRHVQDYDLWKRVVARYDFFHVPQILVRSRQHAQQDSRKHDAVLETEALWRGMVLELNELQRAGMYGSSYRFWSETSKLLHWSPNKQASALCAERADASLRETSVSVLIRVDAHSQQMHLTRSLESVQSQTYQPAEIVVVGPLGIEVSELTTADPIRRIDGGDGDVRAQWNTGLRACLGAYVAMLEAGDTFTPDKIRRQATELMTAGAPLSTTEADGWGGRAPSFASPSTLMVHRSLIAGGQVFTDPGDDWYSASLSRLDAQRVHLSDALTVMASRRSSAQD